MTPQAIKVACSNCNLRELCMPMGLSDDEMGRLDDLVATRRKIKRGTSLFANGDRFTALYAIRTGFFKTCIATADGRDQVTGFQMAGEVIGLDGIVGDRHTCDAVALEDAEVCVMPYDRIEELSREVQALQSHVHKIMSREIVREHGVMLLLGSMRAEERLAAFWGVTMLSSLMTTMLGRSTHDLNDGVVSEPDPNLAMQGLGRD